MPRRTAATALVLIASLGATACGASNKPRADETDVAASESLYRDLGGLTYQVQLSRQLNPKDAEDSEYFTNLTPTESYLPKGDIWFGVFIKVQNQTTKSLSAARVFDIRDTQDQLYDPVQSTNTFAYAPSVVPPKGFIPDQERLQAYAGTQGSLLLFKLPVSTLNNRPLQLSIKSPSDTRVAAKIDLDV